MKKLLSCLFAALFVLSSCNKDDVIEVDSQTAPPYHARQRECGLHHQIRPGTDDQPHL